MATTSKEGVPALLTLYAVIFTATLFTAFAVSYVGNSDIPYRVSRYLHAYFPAVPVLTAFQQEFSHEAYLLTYECRHAYTVQFLSRSPPVLLIEGFLQRGEPEHVAQVAMNDLQLAHSTLLKDGQDVVVECIQQRVLHLLKESRQVRVHRWVAGQHLPPHAGGGMVVYLNDDVKGGGLVFERLNLRVPPAKHAAVVWFDAEAQGSPVQEGEAWHMAL